MKKQLNFLKRSVLTLLVLTFLMGTSKTYAFWATLVNGPNAVINSEQVSIGNWPFEVIEEWQRNAGYEIGDRFTYDGKLWEIRGGGNYNRAPGTGNNLQPYGPYQEITDEYRDYNTYFEGDIVLYNGAEYQALYDGMSGQTPGTVVGWQELTDEWRFYNVYLGGDVVIFEGNTYLAQWYTQGDEPDTNNVWVLQN
ncbi:MAG: carbohydrate-binding protein [Candidatus Izemoplasmataceae bacterium]